MVDIEGTAFLVTAVTWRHFPKAFFTAILDGLGFDYLRTHQAMRVKLTVVGGKASKRTVPVQLPATIGRSRDADLTISHPQISRRHCELSESDGVVLIRDVGSLNGTYVESKRIKEAPLLPDAAFSVGPLTFRIRYQLDAVPERLPPSIPVDEPELSDDPNDSALLGNISETMPLDEEQRNAEP